MYHSKLNPMGAVKDYFASYKEGASQNSEIFRLYDIKKNFLEDGSRPNKAGLGKDGNSRVVILETGMPALVYSPSENVTALDGSGFANWLKGSYDNILQIGSGRNMKFMGRASLDDFEKIIGNGGSLRTGAIMECEKLGGYVEVEAGTSGNQALIQKQLYQKLQGHDYKMGRKGSSFGYIKSFPGGVAILKGDKMEVNINDPYTPEASRLLGRLFEDKTPGNLPEIT